MDILSETRSIRFSDIDQSDTLTLGSACTLFQEAAINHAESLGLGREAMKQSGQVWILSRLSVFMERRPRYGEQVILRSWPRGSNRLFAIRDYDIRAGEKALVRGRSAWLIVDVEKHRPLRPQGAVEKLASNEGLDALPGPNPGNEPPPSPAARTFTVTPLPRRAAYSDLDYNGHVNNTRYIQWIEDLMEKGRLEAARQIRLDINYLSEVRHGETINLYLEGIADPGAVSDAPARPAAAGGGCGTGAAFAIEGRRDDTPVFRAELQLG